MVTIPTTFKAYQFTNFGDVLKEAKLNTEVRQKPLEPTQVRVKVISAAVNPLDYKLLRYGAAFLPTAPSVENPFGMGFDTAGVVVEVGSGDVRGLKLGDAVYGTPDRTAGGSFSDYFAIDSKYLAQKPSNLTFNEAAAVPVAGLTSYQALTEMGKLQAGERVLILGGGGATGQFAIQIAKALGAEVITTASPRNLKLVKSLGADQVVDYTSEKWGSVLAEHSVDLIYDCGVERGSWASDAQKVLKPNGKFVTIGMGPKPVESPIGATFYQLQLHPTPEDLQSLTKLAESGLVKPVVDSVYPFDKVMDAIKLQMSNRAQGKIIVEVLW
ncbi:2-methylene-furan-3-one reductase [Phytophthora citrophthora]|uniref:2-methylene-furan-3-one reductase n=1 Tax=Phytophthora citrophthora TaxID=4793 RepID=A0AAD9G3I1_9STRA|nr:2-methylene-furan-3-one reductase [Phytophthora citrophthora]